MPDGWPLADPEETRAFTLKRVLRGESRILLVLHDEGGDWQFLDGAEATASDGAPVSLGEVRRLDPTTLGLADLPAGWMAWRDDPEGPWKRAPSDVEADIEARIASSVERIGWHVLAVPDDEHGPGFAYSIGLARSFGHPEVIVLGLDPEVMFGIVNVIGEAVKGGRRFSADEPAGGVLDGYDVRFVPVASRHYRDHLGYAGRFHGGEDYPVLQCIWPDMKGVFPDDPGAPEGLRRRQPVLDA